MNKKQLVAKLAVSLNQSKADAERTFDTITNAILDALKGDDNVKIAGFGTYKVAKRKARIGRNPRTGEQIQIGASQKVKFIPAKALKEIFNRQIYILTAFIIISKGCQNWRFLSFILNRLKNLKLLQHDLLL